MLLLRFTVEHFWANTKLELIYCCVEITVQRWSKAQSLSQCTVYVVHSLHFPSANVQCVRSLLHLKMCKCASGIETGQWQLRLLDARGRVCVRPSSFFSFEFKPSSCLLQIQITLFFASNPFFSFKSKRIVTTVEKGQICTYFLDDTKYQISRKKISEMCKIITKCAKCAKPTKMYKMWKTH